MSVARRGGRGLGPSRLASIALVTLGACGGGVGGDAATSDGGRDGGPAFSLPTVPTRCAAPSDLTSLSLSIADPVPTLALARGPSDLALAYVVRVPLPSLARFELQRLALDGSPVGAAIALGPIDMAVPGTVTVVHDGAAYLACTIAVGTVQCFRVDADDTVTDGGLFADVTAVSLAFGAGGTMAAWTEGGMLHVGPLGGSVAVLATTDAIPSIAATDTGYVVGYTRGGVARIVVLDASGAPGSEQTLGPARDTTRVAVAFTGGVVGASFVGPSGDAMAAVLDASGPHVATIGAGASSYGEVAIARVRDGFFATWSDFGGTIGGAFVDLAGQARGAAYAHPVAWDDDAHAIVATDAALVLATNTTPAGAPVDVARIGCP